MLRTVAPSLKGLPQACPTSDTPLGLILIRNWQLGWGGCEIQARSTAPPQISSPYSTYTTSLPRYVAKVVYLGYLGTYGLQRLQHVMPGRWWRWWLTSGRGVVWDSRVRNNALLFKKTDWPRRRAC